MIFTTGKPAFLEFLRNLTPQILLFSVAIVTSAKLDFTKFDITNFFSTLIFFFVLIVFMCAVWVNILLFLENSLPKLTELDAKSKEMNADKIDYRQHLKEIFTLYWTNHKHHFLWLLIASVVIEIALVSVLLASIPPADALLKAMHR